MVKRMILMLLIVGGMIAGIAAIKVAVVKAAIAKGKSFAPPPASVSTLTIKPQSWQPVLSAVGSLKAVHGVTVSTDLAGIVTNIAFESGTQVKKGDVLMQMDTQQEEAQLHSTEAKRDFSKQDLERKRDLAAKKAISASDLDSAESELRQTMAMVEEMKALIGRKRITAPFDGVIGIRQVNLGQYVNPGSMIAPLQSLDPIYVEFSLPQQQVAAVDLGKKLRVSAGGLETPFTGEVTAIDSRVDEATRNITIQGTIANPEHKLRPGMFANIEVLLPQQEAVIAIPSTAVAYAPYGDSVYVIKPAETKDAPSPTEVHQQFVKLGPTRGDQVSVVSGLKAGDEIVTSAVFKLRPNAPVRINNDSPQPSNELNPKPVDT